MSLDIKVTFNKDKTEATIEYNLQYIDKVLPIAQRQKVTKEDILKEFLKQYPNLTISSATGPSSIHNSHGPKRTDGIWTVALLAESRNAKPIVKKTTKSKTSGAPKTKTKKGA